MNDYVTKYLNELEEQLRFINLEIDEPIKVAETSIGVILKSIEKLKNYIVKYTFHHQQEEIIFFKKYKPQFISLLIYHNQIYCIETHKPHGGEKVLRKYLNNELLTLKQYFDKNLEFYRYYRTGSDYLDHKYFIRGKHDIKLCIDSFYFETDHRFSTSHDYKIAKIIANDQLQVYLETELANIERKELKAQSSQKTEASQKAEVHWTGSKVALIELLYAFHSEGSFNNGKAEVKQIAEFIENNFVVELGQYSRAFLELRARKSGRTKYLDTLKEKLIQRMDETDEVL